MQKWWHSLLLPYYPQARTLITCTKMLTLNTLLADSTSPLRQWAHAPIYCAPYSKTELSIHRRVLYLNESCLLTYPSSKCSERGIFSNMLQHLQPLKYHHYAEILVSPQLAPISPIKLTAVSKDVSSNHSNTSGTALSRRSIGPRFNPESTRSAVIHKTHGRARLAQSREGGGPYVHWT